MINKINIKISNNVLIIFLVIIILFIISNIIYIYTQRHNIRINWVVFLTLSRGILAPNRFWWRINDLYKDSTGINVYYKLKNKYDKIAPVNIIGKKTYIAMDIDIIKDILDKSPHLFGVGRLKYSFFKTFMKKNVGVSEGCPWIKRRSLNTQVLNTNYLHPYHQYYHEKIRNIIKKCVPKTFEQFKKVGQMISIMIVLGNNVSKDAYYIFDILEQANSLKSITNDDFEINSELINKFNFCVKKLIDNPNKNSLINLIYLENNISNNLDINEIIDQVPHWIFPIAGSIATTVPRLLLLLSNHKDINDKIIKEMKDNFYNVNRLIYLRKCILEALRLNNPVNSTFRTLLQDYKFDGYNQQFKKGDQFLILNNPVLRDPHIFVEPNIFNPDRWNEKLENSYYALMFNQGPQKCPGKDLAIFILQSFIVNYYLQSGIIKYSKKLITNNIDINYISQAINPYKINIILE